MHIVMVTQKLTVMVIVMVIVMVTQKLTVMVIVMELLSWLHKNLLLWLLSWLLITH